MGRSRQIVSMSDHSGSMSESLENEPRRRRNRRERQNKFIKRMVDTLMPNSKGRLSWELFIFVVIWYNSVMTPIRLFIMTGERTPPILVFADIALDVIFVVDTALHFFRPSVDKDTGRTITNLKQIRTKYMSSFAFKMNVVACIPILKTPLAPLLNQEENIALSTNFNILRMIRIFHFPAQFEELKMFLERKEPVNEPVFRMGIILFFTQLAMCIFGCFYFGWSSATVGDICPGPHHFIEEVLDAEIWIAKDEIITNVMSPEICSIPEEEVGCDDCPQMLFFLRSVYFLMQTLFTIGYGDTVVPSRSTMEIAMACVFMLIGVFGYGLIIANMTSVLSNIDVVRMRFRHEMDNVNKWLMFRSVPDSLRERVEMFFAYLERSQHGMLDNVLFDGLPRQLAKDITESNRPLIEQVPFFRPQYRSKAFISNITSVLIRRIYAPGSYILYEGEKQRELVIIKNGRVGLYVRATAEVVGTLVNGDFIGDYQLLFGTVNQLGARSVEFTEALALTFHAFENVMDHPSQNDIDFRSLGGNLRRSEDLGAKETLQQAQIRMQKIATYISYMKSQSKSRKLLNMLGKSEVQVKGLRIPTNSPIHVYWNIFAIVAIMYEAISCPIRFASNFRSSTLKTAHSWVFMTHYFTDAAFLIDMYLRFNAYAYISFDDGRNVTIVERELIRKNYLNSPWFRIDAIASIPFDIFALVFDYHTMSRIPKVLRVMQLPRLVSRLRQKLDDCLGVTVQESIASGAIMFLSTILIIVWSSAGWNALRYDESAYKSVYWALTTLTTVGYGDFTPDNFRETVYAVVVGAVGATFTAGIIANVTSFFHDVDISEDNIDHKVNSVMRFMEHHSRPHEQVKKIQEYFDYIEREHGGVNEDLWLRKALPDHLKTNLLIHVTQSMINNCSFFLDCEAGFLRQLMTSLDQRFFGSQTMILTSSIPSDGMYFVKSGTVDLLGKSNSGDLKPFKRLDVDSYFAEECLLEHWDENPYLAIAVSDSELWHLSRSVFNRLVDDYPHVRVLLTKIARSSKQKGNRRGSIHAMTKAIENTKMKSALFIHPDNYFIQFWFGLILLVTVYSVITLPFRLAFMENYERNIYWTILDYFGDFLLLVDVVIRSCFLAYYDDNHLVIQREMIWKNYLKSGKMKWHILSLLPLEILLSKTIPTMCPLWKLQAWSLYRMNKMLRLVEVSGLMHQVESTMARVGVRVPKNAIRVGKLLMVILLSAHLVACIFYTIASFDQYGNSSNSPQNWANDEGLFVEPLDCPGKAIDQSLMMQRYVASLYWSMATLTTVGYGDITANESSVIEISFATVIIIIGTAIYTLVIALLEDIVSQLDVTSSLHKLRTDKVTAYCQLESLPDALKIKIDAYYDNLWQRQLGVNGTKLLTFFPTSFRAEMLLDMMSPLLQKTFFVKDCTADFVGHILSFIKFEFYLPGDSLFYEGERCSSLLFLYKGDVDLLTSKHVKFKTVCDCVLGDASFFGFEPHLCSAKAVNACEIFSFSMEDFTTCVHEHQLSKQYAEYVVQNNDHLLESKEAITKMIKNLKSSKMEKMLISENITTIPKGVVLPEEFKRCAWDCVLFIQIIILAFLIPFETSFLDNVVGLEVFLLDSCMDTVFLLDIFGHLTKFAKMKDGVLLVEPSQFRRIYLQNDFRWDLFTSAPMSTIGYFFGFRDRSYGFLRCFQFLRIRHFGKYLNIFVENINAKTKFTISTAQLRLVQIFFIVLFLCHWFACAFHLLGQTQSDNTWLIVDDSTSTKKGGLYLRSFYWSLYTVTTIGYGSIPVVTNLERIFAMFVMAVGAVICDAGITAILTSIISIRDQQSGTNNRRIQCTKRYMSNNMVGKNVQSRILDYYKYDDTELANIKEENILKDLSSSLKFEVMRHFCFKPLRCTDLFADISDGALGSLIQSMQPYLAVPSENLSIMGESCESLFVLKRGRVRSIDSSGAENMVKIGSVIGHIATASTYKRLGLPSKILEIKIVKGKGFKTKYGLPYAVFTSGFASCRSVVRKSMHWNENIVIKLCDDDSHTLHICVRSWQSGNVHTVLGSNKISIAKCSNEDRQVILQDSNGRNAGTLYLTLTLRDLTSNEMLRTHEKTTTALGYSHMYSIDAYQLDDLHQYLEASKKENAIDRLRGSFLEHTTQEHLTEMERIKHSWRRPSRPSIHIKTPKHNLRNDKLHRKAIQRPSINSNEDHSNESEICSKQKSRPLLTKKNSFLPILVKHKSIAIRPTADEDDPEKGSEEIPKDNEDSRKKSWNGSNTVRTKTLAVPSSRQIGNNNLNTEVEGLSENDRRWDILADVNGQSSRSGGRQSRRATVYMEWLTDDTKHV